MTKIKESEKEVFFSTRDITLAATLCTLGFFNENIDYQVEGSRQQPVGYFCYEDNSKLRDAERKFQRKEIMVEPQEFMSNLKNLKSRVTNVFKSPHSPFSKTNE